MTERAAHLVDHVWPEAPVRQWVLSLPPGVRYLLAWRHDLCTAVAGVLYRAVHRHLRSWAQTHGLGDARSGAVIVVQRFGGALNLNVHLHALVLDGVFARAGDGRLRFHRAAAPTTADIADVLAAIVPAVRRRLAVGGSGDDAMEGADRFADAAPVLAGLAVASVRGVLAVGGVPGRRPERLGEAGREEAGGRRTASRPETPHARWEGFDLHAGVAVPGHPARLERLCRYVLRPPVTGDRLSWTPTGGSCCRCAIRGRTARRICGSSRRRSWSGSPCWCRGRASTCCSITGCWRRGRRGGLRWWRGRRPPPSRAMGPRSRTPGWRPVPRGGAGPT